RGGIPAFRSGRGTIGSGDGGRYRLWWPNPPAQERCRAQGTLHGRKNPTQRHDDTPDENLYREERCGEDYKPRPKGPDIGRGGERVLEGIFVRVHDRTAAGRGEGLEVGGVRLGVLVFAGVAEGESG